MIGLLLLSAAWACQDTPAALAELLSHDDVVARKRNVEAVVERGMKAVPALRALESGDFSPEARAGARTAREEILRRHRVASCRPGPDVKVSLPPGEYSLEEAAARALKPFGLTEIGMEKALEGKRFRFALESASVWTSIHEICRQGKVSWKTTHDDRSRLFFHEITAAGGEKTFALVGPYRVQARIEHGALELAVGVPPNHALSHAALSNLRFKDAEGRRVEPEKVDDWFSGGRMPGLYGYYLVGVVRGKPDLLERITQIEGDLAVETAEDLRVVDFDMPAIEKKGKVPFRILDSVGDVEVLEPTNEDPINLYFSFECGTEPRVHFTWIEDADHRLLVDLHPWGSGHSGNIQSAAPAKAVPQWLVVARVEKSSRQTYSFDCRRQKP